MVVREHSRACSSPLSCAVLALHEHIWFYMEDDVAVAEDPGIVEGLVVLTACIGRQIAFATAQVSHRIRLA